MRAVVQRVLQAAVEVDGRVVASIETGLLVLIGIHGDDTAGDMEYIGKKISGLRIFADDAGQMNRSVQDTDGGVLLVPQFTLYGDARKGKRPSWSEAMPPERASVFFQEFVEYFRTIHSATGSGIFGADMKVSLVNWGPVTILLDSSRNF